MGIPQQPLRPDFACFLGRLTILTGPFGVGKTEIAINLARELARQGDEVDLIDLDVVTPYFRPRELRHELAQVGVHVTCPTGSVEHTDLPAVPGDVGRIMRAGAMGESTVVVDLGGEEQGSRVLASLGAALTDGGQWSILFVINPYRPECGSVGAARRVLSEITATVGRSVTGVIANPNLKSATTPQVLAEGEARCHQIADGLGLSIVMQCRAATDGLEVDSEGETPRLSLSLTMLLPFEEGPAQVGVRARGDTQPDAAHPHE